MDAALVPPIICARHGGNVEPCPATDLAASSALGGANVREVRGALPCKNCSSCVTMQNAGLEGKGCEPAGQFENRKHVPRSPRNVPEGQGV